MLKIDADVFTEDLRCSKLMKHSGTLGYMNEMIKIHGSIINLYFMMNWYIAVILFVSRMKLVHGQAVTGRTKESVIGEA